MPNSFTERGPSPEHISISTDDFTCGGVASAPTFEALVDVVVRPAAGVGERQLESVLQAALRQLIPVKNYPKGVIQITLQVAQTPENEYVNRKTGSGSSGEDILIADYSRTLTNATIKNLPIVPALLHASILGLLTAAIPLKAITAATLLAMPEGTGDNIDIIVDPSAAEADKAKSIHILGFTSQDELLFAESEGSFSPQEWAKVLERGQRICCQHQELDLTPHWPMATLSRRA